MSATLPSAVLFVSALIFTIGLVGALFRRNLVAILMCLQLMLLAADLAFVGGNFVWAATSTGAPRSDGQVFAYLVTVAAAAHSVLGLAVVVALVRGRHSVDIDETTLQSDEPSRPSDEPTRPGDEPSRLEGIVT